MKYIFFFSFEFLFRSDNFKEHSACRLTCIPVYLNFCIMYVYIFFTHLCACTVNVKLICTTVVKPWGGCWEHQISILCLWAVGCWSGMVDKMMARHTIKLLGKTKPAWYVQQMIQNWPHVLHCILSLSYYTLRLFII